MWTFSHRGTFWTSAAVLVMCLGSSAAPSVLYPLYAEAWNLTPVAISSVFGMYPLGLLVVLLLVGAISDVVGRRRVMLAGMAMLAFSAVILAVASDVGWLFVGRFLQGLAIGLSLSAATASLVENNPTTRQQLPGTISVAATGVGLAMGTILPGLLAEYAPWPLSLTHILFFLLTSLVFVAVLLTPESHAPPRSGLNMRARARTAAIALPRGFGLAFAASTLCVSAGYAMGAVFLALGAQMARELTHTSDSLIIGSLLALSSVATAIGAAFSSRVTTMKSVLLGGTLIVIAIGCMALMATFGSVGWFIAWCLIGGFGFTFLLSGGFGLLNRTAPAESRGGAISLLYVFAYAAQAIFALAAGAIATSVGLERAVIVVAPVLAAAIMASILLTFIQTRQNRRGLS
jgi:MFS family permease